MRPFGFIVAALALAPGVLGKGKKFIVSFEDKNTPDSVVDQAKKDITDKGGKITHVFTIIKGFSAEAPEEAMKTVSAWGAEKGMRVEEDQIVSFDV